MPMPAYRNEPEARTLIGDEGRNCDNEFWETIDGRNALDYVLEWGY
jgi:hypothetical protein